MDYKLQSKFPKEEKKKEILLILKMSVKRNRVYTAKIQKTEY